MIILIWYENVFAYVNRLKPFFYALDRWKSINEPEIYIAYLNLIMKVSNSLNFTYVIRFKLPLSSAERDWASAYDCRSMPTSATERRRVAPKCSESPLRRDWTCTSVARLSPFVTRDLKNHIGQIFHQRSTVEVLNISKLSYDYRRYWCPVALGEIHPRLYLHFVALNCLS